MRHGIVTEITLNKSELLALLFKLDDPESAKALIRRGEDGNEYWIQAIQDESPDDIKLIHPRTRKRIEKFYEWEKTDENQSLRSHAPPTQLVGGEV